MAGDLTDQENAPPTAEQADAELKQGAPIPGAGLEAIVYDAATEFGYIDRGGHRFSMQFQHGVVPEGGVNGLWNEDVIQMLVLRLTALQAKLPCRENAVAITKLQEALFWLNERARLREAQGVEGVLDEAHVSH